MEWIDKDRASYLVKDSKVIAIVNDFKDYWETDICSLDYTKFMTLEAAKDYTVAKLSK